MELRDYQKESVDELRSAFRSYKHVIFQLPTGGGKGVVIGAVSSMALNKGNRVLILAHSEEIIKQDARHCGKWGAETAIVLSKTKKAPGSPCVCMMAQTARQRVKKEDWLLWFRGFKMIILDECHRAEFDFVFDVISPDTYVVGLSASPARYGGQRQLGLDYEAIVTGPSVQDLIGIAIFCLLIY